MRFIVQFDDKMYRFVTFGLHNNFTNETHSLFAVFCMQFEVFTPLALHLGGLCNPICSTWHTATFSLTTAPNCGTFITVKAARKTRIPGKILREAAAW